jgi:hypothetical protein
MLIKKQWKGTGINSSNYNLRQIPHPYSVFLICFRHQSVQSLKITFVCIFYFHEIAFLYASGQSFKSLVRCILKF